jgi:hypothetical protein
MTAIQAGLLNWQRKWSYTRSERSRPSELHKTSVIWLDDMPISIRFWKIFKVANYTNLLCIFGARGGVVVKALRFKLQVAGSIHDGVIGIF